MISSDWSSKKTLLLVDDEPANLHVLREILQEDYHLLFARDGMRAVELCLGHFPDLVLLDVQLPGMSGYEVCRALKADPGTASIPVIFVSAMAEETDETAGFAVGAVDYIAKPLSRAIVKARVSTHLSLVRVDELEKTRLQIIQRLGRAAEYRDNETGLHVIRMSHFSRLLVLAAGLSEHAADELFHAAPMHDVGKIGIPDNILLKPGALDAEEWRVMMRHSEIGAEIIEAHHESSLLQTAYRIALTHHEKWDGSGYPAALKGEEIPLSGRIVAIADVFDALTSDRPYKKAWSVGDAVELIRRESGKHFDPRLAELFIGIIPQVVDVMRRWADPSSGGRAAG